jgi:short-subunit dehydrogenase
MWLSVDQVVATSMKDLGDNKVISIPGIQYKILTTAGRLVPKGLVRKMTNLVGRGRGRT